VSPDNLHRSAQVSSDRHRLLPEVSARRSTATGEHSDPLRVLLVEDTDEDEALLLRALKSAGYVVTCRRVETAEAMLAALDAEAWHIVISDHSLPRFSSSDALACLRQRELDLPFIVVSGTIDEDGAIAILRAGAHDFVTKQNLARLGPAIRRELEDAQVRAERREAQQNLATQRDFLRLVLDTTPTLIYVKDSGGRFTLANQAVADLYGTTVTELIEGDGWHAQVDQNRVEQDVIATGEPRLVKAFETTQRGTGAPRWFDMRYVPLVLPDGTSQMLGIGTEITDQRHAEDALRSSEEQFRQAQKMEAIGQLAGGIAHDFNNLLTAILGYSELLRDQIANDPELAGDLAEIHKAGTRASELTAQLLAFSRKQVLEPRILNLNDAIADAERILRRVIGEDVSLEVGREPALLPIKADPGQIQQVIMNLAVNARDAMPRGGTLRMSTANVSRSTAGDERGTRVMAPHVVLAVSDTGSGISREVQARMFEPFFTTKGPGKGTGLGLSMVYGVISQSGGSIEVQSEPGHGTTFNIYLPACLDEIEVARVPEPMGRIDGNETILLVEDEPGVRELVHKILRSHGYSVLEAANPRAAMEIAATFANRLDLLLSDIVMPDMSGPELAQCLVPKRPEMRVLYMSGFVHGLGTTFGTLSPAVALLNKPFTPEALLRKVRECLDWHNANG
jgi:two-component system, cell cycle sensor histidine kinase and response regulator CckA